MRIYLSILNSEGKEMRIKQLLVKHQERIISIKKQVIAELEVATYFEKALAMEYKIDALNHKMRLLQA
jgi:hypothetical protein